MCLLWELRQSLQTIFLWSAPVAFRRVALETPEWTSRDSNHHRQSVSAGKNAIPTEPSGRLGSPCRGAEELEGPEEELARGEIIRLFGFFIPDRSFCLCQAMKKNKMDRQSAKRRESSLVKVHCATPACVMPFSPHLCVGFLFLILYPGLLLLLPPPP